MIENSWELIKQLFFVSNFSKIGCLENFKNIKIILYKNKTNKIRVIFIYKNNLTKLMQCCKIKIGDGNVKKRNIFEKN